MEKRGITLIALVITIIVLLILAGITINLTIGNQGVITRAQQASRNYKDAEQKEQDELDNFDGELEDVLSGMEGTKVDGSWNEIRKVNSPKIDGTGLTAVTLAKDGTILDADISKIKWYNYENKEWANAKTADGSLWVWIPRFAYKIKYPNEGDKSQAGEIDVKFLQGTTNLDENGEDVVAQGYIVHPAFESGKDNNYANGEWDEKIPGFWMAKFEAGYAKQEEDKVVESNIIYSENTGNVTNYYGEVTAGTTKINYPVFKPNRASYNYITIGDSFDLCRDIETATEVYGLTEKVDSHLTKNSEWGAVAYLAWSKYGQEKTKVRINNVTPKENEKGVFSVTGYGAIGTSATDVQEDKTRDLNTLLGKGSSGNWTESTSGQKASTTGNITGIYDMNGGLWERVAAYIIPADTGSTTNYGKYKWNSIGDSNKYQTKFEGTEENRDNNYNNETNAKKIGDAIYETSKTCSGYTSWNGEYSGFIYATDPFIFRGGSRQSGLYSGLFAYSHTDGRDFTDYGFRAVLIAE